MSQPKCSRVWIVEAVRDGRVWGADREAVERHLKTCPDCQVEARDLEELGQTLRRLPTLEAPPLAVRRHRQRLMAEADAATLVQTRSTWSRAVLGSLIVSAGLVLALGWRSVNHRKLPAIEHLAEEPSIEVRAEPGAQWRRKRVDQTTRILLDDGTIWLRIHRPPGSGRVLITTPDAEIEDFGTALRVEVANGQVREIAVEAGSVAVRSPVFNPELRLAAGETWKILDKVVAPPSVTSAHGVGFVAAPRRPREPARHEPRAEPPASDRNEPIAESVDAEDRVYLHVVSLSRAGKMAEAHALAREYLLRFPNGFRRVEMLDMVTGRPDGR